VRDATTPSLARSARGGGLGRGRRHFLSLLLALPFAAHAHTPYRQWAVYRQRFLLILSSRDDPPSDELAERFAATLRETLPASRAQVARAPHVDRIASLMSSRQMDAAVLQEGSVRALFKGDAPFVDYGPVPLRVLAQSAGYQFVCREDFKKQHAYLVTEALIGSLPGVKEATVADTANGVPLHAGTLAFLRGEPFEE
jgi:hypothetical protein